MSTSVRLVIAVTVPRANSMFDNSDWLTDDERAAITPDEQARLDFDASPEGCAAEFMDYASGWCICDDVTYEVVAVEECES